MSGRSEQLQAWEAGMPVWLASQLDGRRTPNDIVRVFKPDATDEEAAYLLWERTAFPVSDIAHWVAQLRDEVSGVQGGSPR